MGRQREPFWEYVEDLHNGRFKCQFCRNEFSGGISRVKSHLSGVKGRDIEICLNVPDNVRDKAYQAIGGPSKKRKSIAVSINGDNGGIISTSTTCENDKNVVDKKLVKFLRLSNISEDIQFQAFIDFVKKVTELGPGYELPNLVLQAKLVSDYDTEILGYIHHVKKSWVTTGCTLMLEAKELDEETWLNIFACSLRGVVFLKSARITLDRLTDDLCNIVSPTIDEIGANNVVQLLLDDFEHCEIFWAIRGTFSKNSKYPHLYVCRCAIYEIQNLLRNIYDEVDWVRRIIIVGKVIMSYIHKCGVKLSLQIQEHTKYKRLEHPCLALFASDFLLLHSISEFETELRALQLPDASSGWGRLDINMQELAKWVANVIESTTFWTLSKDVLHIVDPLFQVLRLVSCRAPTTGYFYEVMKKARNAIWQCCEKDEAKYEDLWDLFDETWLDTINPIHAAAAALNPANRCDEKFQEDPEMTEGISFIQNNLVTAYEVKNFLRQVQRYREKDPRVFTTTSLETSKTLHPRIWWDYFGGPLPLLQKYAIRILSQPCSSPFNIKKFKVMTNVDSKRMNLRMMEIFNGPKAHDKGAIDLGKLTGFPESVNHQDLEDFSDIESVYEIKKDDTFDDPLRLWLHNKEDFKHLNLTP